jgi:hypothetical protein
VSDRNVCLSDGMHHPVCAIRRRGRDLLRGSYSRKRVCRPMVLREQGRDGLAACSRCGKMTAEDRALQTGSHRTRCWREVDSNPRSPVKKKPIYVAWAVPWHRDARQLGPLRVKQRLVARLGLGRESYWLPSPQASLAHPRGKPRFSTLESGCGRETDCPLEGAGFEP